MSSTWSCEAESAVKIQILGTGCAKCQKLAQVAEQAAGELGLAYEMEKVTDPMRMAQMGVMRTPALAVDGVVKLSGRVPEAAELKLLLGAPR
ncbi:thioredoxin family protein [Falsiroseomonas bella]|uniref:Thioredoxin family protein n=1 Tax=Falsiroseomonas bella TaxID=2184016 RepID=A0A317F9C6_9PROT|nr:thioredoxin family protein [Falsiroseomonas bella]